MDTRHLRHIRSETAVDPLLSLRKSSRADPDLAMLSSKRAASNIQTPLNGTGNLLDSRLVRKDPASSLLSTLGKRKADQNSMFQARDPKKTKLDVFPPQQEHMSKGTIAKEDALQVSQARTPTVPQDAVSWWIAMDPTPDRDYLAYCLPCVNNTKYVSRDDAIYHLESTHFVGFKNKEKSPDPLLDAPSREVLEDLWVELVHSRDYLIEDPYGPNDDFRRQPYENPADQKFEPSRYIWLSLAVSNPPTINIIVCDDFTENVQQDKALIDSVAKVEGPIDWRVIQRNCFPAVPVEELRDRHYIHQVLYLDSLSRAEIAYEAKHISDEEIAQKFAKLPAILDQLFPKKSQADSQPEKRMYIKDTISRDTTGSDYQLSKFVALAGKQLLFKNGRSS